MKLLCVGIIDLPAKYKWLGESTSMHFTGTEDTGITDLSRKSLNEAPHLPTRSAEAEKVVAVWPNPHGHSCSPSAIISGQSTRPCSDSS